MPNPAYGTTTKNRNIETMEVNPNKLYQLIQGGISKKKEKMRKPPPGGTYICLTTRYLYFWDRLTRRRKPF